jgi:hypothetical protein
VASTARAPDVHRLVKDFLPRPDAEGDLLMRGLPVLELAAAWRVG